MKKTVFIFLMSAWLGIVYFSQPQKLSSLEKKGDLQSPKSLSAAPLSRSLNPTTQMVQIFTNEISQIQDDPVAAELRMREAAQSLTESDLSELTKIALNTQLNHEDRFVAVTLLAWSKDPKAAERLVKIASLTFDPLLSPNQQGDFEKILRMSAVEGLQELPLTQDQQLQSLNEIIAKSDLEPVVDRAMRSLWAQQNLAKTPANQDLEALSQILSPSGPFRK